MNQQPEKALLNLDDFCSYLGIGNTMPIRSYWTNGLTGIVGISL